MFKPTVGYCMICNALKPGNSCCSSQRSANDILSGSVRRKWIHYFTIIIIIAIIMILWWGGRGAFETVFSQGGGGGNPICLEGVRARGAGQGGRGEGAILLFIFFPRAPAKGSS